MIQTKEDYLSYVAADRKANGCSSRKSGGLKGLLRRWVAPDSIVDFLESLRYVEYLNNAPHIRFRSIRKLWGYYWFNKLSAVNGFTIPINTFGPGLSIAHRGTIVVNGAARIGANCRIHVCVNIGTSKGEGLSAPKIGDNVYIAPGAKIFGPIEIADNCVIGANAVVNKSCLTPNTKLLGVPAKEFH